MLSRVHSPPHSLSTDSISCLSTGAYSGYAARLNIELVISWLVVLTDTAPIPSWEIPWKWGSFLSGSGTRSLSHSMASMGFFKFPVLFWDCLCWMIGERRSRALALHLRTIRSSEMKYCTKGRSQGWKSLSFAEERNMFLVYCGC